LATLAKKTSLVGSLVARAGENPASMSAVRSASNSLKRLG
jgi:hypothetical protein